MGDETEAETRAQVDREIAIQRRAKEIATRIGQPWPPTIETWNTLCDAVQIYERKARKVPPARRARRKKKR